MITLTTIFSVSAFAKSGFEFILNVPIGASYSILSQNMKDYKIKNSFGLDAGVEAQLGYRHNTTISGSFRKIES